MFAFCISLLATIIHFISWLLLKIGSHIEEEEVFQGDLCRVSGILGVPVVVGWGGSLTYRDSTQADKVNERVQVIGKRVCAGNSGARGCQYFRGEGWVGV